ncbi:MAG: tRNA lysidine(34) synthetase TilS [Bacteroidota bacterium]
MNLLQKFQQNWQKHFCHLSPANCQLLLTISGGVDSVVLVDLIHNAGFNYQIAHCNFQLRGEESERDEKFVRSLGEKYGKEVLVKRFDTKNYSIENKISIQEAARDLRYAWFQEIVGSWQMTDDDTKGKSVNQHLSSNNFILTAHHADDNIETLLMHFFRGTGIQGMMGIQPMVAERKLIRPLLSFRKAELLSYAEEHGLSFVEDSSNASDKYTRNFFRNQLLPQIKEVFPQVEDNLQNNIERFHEVADLYRQSVELHKHKLLEQKGNEWHIPVLKWKKVKPRHTITWEIIKDFGFNATQTEEVIKLFDAENGSYQSSPTHRIIRNRNWMIISPNATEAALHILVEENDKEIFFEAGSLALKIHHSPSTIHNSASEAFLNVEEISFPLLLRKYKTGDYFYPLGMQKKKKISRFLIDLKLSKTDKEKVWVIESNKKIIWVVGYRIDNRFRITDQTKTILHINFRRELS